MYIFKMKNDALKHCLELREPSLGNRRQGSKRKTVSFSSQSKIGRSAPPSYGVLHQVRIFPERKGPCTCWLDGLVRSYSFVLECIFTGKKEKTQISLAKVPALCKQLDQKAMKKKGSLGSVPKGRE